jgi:nucleotide-binding universal stress UspA family protein
MEDVEAVMNPVTLSPPSSVGQASRVRFKNILFATDLAASSISAQAYALLLAQMFGSHLFVLYVHTGPGLSPRYQQAWTSGAKGEARAIAQLEDFFRASQVPFTLLVEQGEVPEVLDRVAGENAIDLIILGTHGRKGFSHVFFGSMAENVSRSSTSPVITVGPRARTGFENSLRTIIYGTDFTEESRLALPYAVSLAQEFHAELVIMHVAPEHMLSNRLHVEGYLMNRLKTLAPQSRFPWCNLKHIVEFGQPVRQILEAANDWNADLIVLGLHNSVQFTSHFPERLSYSIVCDAPCPVMSVLPSVREIKVARVTREFLAFAPQMN